MIELDKRILPDKKPLTAFDVMESKFIGTDCYFSDKASDYGDLSNCQIGSLLSRDGMTGLFNATKNNSYANFNYCLPCEWVKSEESKKKYRPFSIEDWKFKHSVGKTILYRYKGTYCDDHREAEVMYLGYVKPLDGITDEAGKGELVLGNESLGLQNLFNNYEIWADGEWKPFGMEE
jgi:hypothetical protein